MNYIKFLVTLFTIIIVIACGNKSKDQVLYYDGDEFTAQTEEGVEMRFKVISAENKTVQVGIGDKDNHNQAIDTKYKGKVTIPQEVNGFRVESISEYAFGLCDMSKIEIPEGVRTIQDDAFFMCDYIREIKLPTSLTTIGNGAFAGCDRLHSIYIPRNVEQISDRIVSERYVSSITVDKENKYYDSRNNCNAIIETSSNTLIQGCNSTIIPEGIVTIGTDAFSGSEFSSCNIPSSVKFIEEHAFSMVGLKEIYIPQNVEMISPTAFRCYDNEIQKITVDEKNKKFDSRNNCNAIIETSTGTLVRGCQNTIIPVGIAKIGSDAFTGCGFQTINLPSSIKSIDEKAFDRCGKMKTIVLPEGLETISTEAFIGCVSLERFIIPSTVRVIGTGVLKNCPSLANISVAVGNSHFDSRNNCNAIIRTNTNSLRAGCKNATIPNNVVKIEEDAFYGSGVKHIVIPPNVVEIGKHALGDAKIITSLISEPYPVYHDIDTLYVPKGTKEKYEKCKGWKKAKHIIELETN